ncbi:MAG: hypothetical protein KAJ23_07505 [Maribacter sp.]|nr:hypothetical protein [Maribacter sp.]
MNTSEIHPLPKETFESLMEKSALHCVTIYLPMDKKGKEQNLHLAQARLKKCIRQAQEQLANRQMHVQDIADFLQPIEQLLDKVGLWRNPSDGLALFLDSGEALRYYKVPIMFEERTYVAGHFYLLPLLPLYHNDGLYYLLELSQDYVKLYEASRHHFKDLYLEDFAPGQLEEAVGFDYKPKMLQFRTGQNIHSAGAFHGHGEGKDDDKKEIISFFRAVDKGVKKVIVDQNAPLVLACTDYLLNLYRETSTYPNVYDTNVSGDPEFKVKTSLHQASWVLMESYFKRTQTEKVTQFNERYHTQKTSYEIDDILNAALNGRVDTLFIQNDTDIYGICDMENNEVTIDDQEEIYNTSLTNLAAMETFRQGGNVYFLSSDEMPVKGNSMNALFRY